MNDEKQSLTDVAIEVMRMKEADKDNLIVQLNAGNLAKQQYISGLEDLLTKLETELKLRADNGKELRDHLRQCNGEMFQLKSRIKELENES